MNSIRQSWRAQPILRVLVGGTLSVVLAAGLWRLHVPATMVTGGAGLLLVFVFGGWFIARGMRTQSSTRTAIGIALLVLGLWGTVAETPRPWLLTIGGCAAIVFALMYTNRNTPIPSATASN